MEKLILLQGELYDEIAKSQSNYRKTPKERIKQAYIETRLQRLEEQFLKFTKRHEEIILLAPIDRSASYFTENKYEQVEELYVNYKTMLKEALQLFLPTYKHKPSEQNSTAVDVGAANNCCDVKLPRINIPTFSGKYEEWQTFFDMFSSLIHSNNNISSVQKLHYLKGSLTGEALNLLRNLSITEANYQEAWSQLIRRYNNKRYNCNAVLRSLFSLKKINTESAHAIKHLVDATSTCLKSLQSMGISVNTWDAIIVFLVVSKLDPESMKQWEQQLNANADELPTWDQLRIYLESRFRSLEMVDSNLARPAQTKTKAFHMSVENKLKNSDMDCAMCHDKHFIFNCKQFGIMTPRDRQDFVQNNKLCFNCLSLTHAAIKCRRSTSCKKCGKRHHTLLHFERERSHQVPIPASDVTSSVAPVGPGVQHPQERPGPTRGECGDTHVTTAFSIGEVQPNSVLLATARVKVLNSNHCKIIIRALLDQGSQASFITEATAQLLGLTRKPVSGWVSGLGDGRMRIKNFVSLYLESRHNPLNSIKVDAYVLHSLTSFLPSNKINVPQWTEIANLPLADPTYAVPGKIDILLGAEVYGEILVDGMVKQSGGCLVAQNTLFGWILSGRTVSEALPNTNLMSMHVQVKEDDLLRKFWEIENEPNMIQKEMTKTEKICEEFFESTTVRDEEGRLVVRLPFAMADPKCQYGNSKEIAIKRFEILEKRLARDSKLRLEYNKVMEEYLTLKHMIQLDGSEIDNPKAVYLPHHAVVREGKETTKVRVVFDASCKLENDTSLNGDLLVGPKLQDDLRHILMRWRTHKVSIVADIEKMYRMVRVAEQDSDYQRLVWRIGVDGPIKHYKLLRLTFGTACAPYLAVKCLHKLADLEEINYPLAARITRRDFYMDDLITGANNDTEALKIYNEINSLLNSGGFKLQKWNSNSKLFLQKIGKSNELNNSDGTLKLNQSIKILGVIWNRENDNFEYTLNLSKINNYITKRHILSDVARLYDPLGWVAPVVVVAKSFIQKLWKTGLDWDDCLDEVLLTQWMKYRNELVALKELKIPRWLNITSASKTELHVFSDASKLAYAAAVYMRVVNEKRQVHAHLITAKTKIAPIEKEISIPRLELCGAALAAKLIFEVSQVMSIPKENLYAWTDSAIVLAWLKGGSARWTTFVANRVSSILNVLEFEQWNHVASESNPADCASRGLQANNLLGHSLWWKGPQWLLETSLPTERISIEDTHEEEKIQSLTVLSHTENESLWLRFSSLSRLLRVLSYCRRMLRFKLPEKDLTNLPKHITTTELNETLLTCIKQVQATEFYVEINQLKSRGYVSRKSGLRTLCPFVDDKGILRVRGRITQSDTSYDMRHPIIMPGKNHFTKLIVLDAHYQTLHGGPQAMLHFLRMKYWILNAKERVKKCYRECVICLKYSAKKNTPLMGLLPEVRVKPSKPFKSTGVDYCGPINLRASPGRGSRSYKGYICLFVCLVTRAIHLEAVSDLTAKGFIAAFRRFTARRGHCQDLYSDNGTNFVGADRELREMFDKAISTLLEEISELLTLERTTWHFIPPHAPNFGGIWERGVRSTKTHLRKVIGDSTLTYEEMAIVLTQVEACLNSRPLSVLSDDPNDPLPLTPGHFLVGEPLINIADDDNCDKSNIIGLNRWRLIQKMVNDFWKRWYREYLTTLNQRHKWNSNCSEPEIGDVVVLKEDNVPPTKWVLGKIILKYTGPDKITRVVTVKCKSGIFKRPLSKLCVLTK